MLSSKSRTGPIFKGFSAEEKSERPVKGVKSSCVVCRTHPRTPSNDSNTPSRSSLDAIFQTQKVSIPQKASTQKNMERQAKENHQESCYCSYHPEHNNPTYTPQRNEIWKSLQQPPLSIRAWLAKAHARMLFRTMGSQTFNRLGVEARSVQVIHKASVSMSVQLRGTGPTALMFQEYPRNGKLHGLKVCSANSWRKLRGLG